MRLAADRPWNDIEITDIAEAAGVSLSEFRDNFPSKGAVLGGLAAVALLAGAGLASRWVGAFQAAVRG